METKSSEMHVLNKGFDGRRSSPTGTRKQTDSPSEVETPTLAQGNLTHNVGDSLPHFGRDFRSRKSALRARGPGSRMHAESQFMCCVWSRRPFRCEQRSQVQVLPPQKSSPQHRAELTKRSRRPIQYKGVMKAASQRRTCYRVRIHSTEIGIMNGQSPALSTSPRPFAADLRDTQRQKA